MHNITQRQYYYGTARDGMGLVHWGCKAEVNSELVRGYHMTVIYRNTAREREIVVDDGVEGTEAM